MYRARRTKRPGGTTAGKACPIGRYYPAAAGQRASVHLKTNCRVIPLWAGLFRHPSCSRTLLLASPDGIHRDRRFSASPAILPRELPVWWPRLARCQDRAIRLLCWCCPDFTRCPATWLPVRRCGAMPVVPPRCMTSAAAGAGYRARCTRLLKAGASGSVSPGEQRATGQSAWGAGACLW